MVFLVAGLLAFPSVLCVGLNAQVSGGVLSGTVMDGSQAAIPNVRVTLTNVATGVARAVATDATGSYTVPDLLPGSYDMTAAASGFTTQARLRFRKPGRRGFLRSRWKCQFLYGAGFSAERARLDPARHSSGGCHRRADGNRRGRRQHGARFWSSPKHFRSPAGSE